MCDETTLTDPGPAGRGAGVSRRGFGAMAGGAALTIALPRAAFAVDVAEREVRIETPDGACDAHFAHPAGGAAPGVLVWPDIMGLRPALRAMGRRLAESGYAVLTVNQFYRSQSAPVTAGETLQEALPRLRGLRALLTAQTDAADSRAFVAWLDSQDAVDSGRGIGVAGYCMGGPQMLRAAAAAPERVRAGASFHDSGLVTAGADSPHLLIPRTRADFLFAIAANDDAAAPEAKRELRAAADAAGRPAEIEVYADAPHGWCIPDSASYRPEQAERAWARLLALFGAALA